MGVSLLIVAAIYELLTAGEKFLSKSTLPICSGSNPQSFKSISGSFRFSNLTVNKTSMRKFINYKMSEIDSYFEDMRIDQANDILNQFSALQNSEFWQYDKNVSLISTSYSPDARKFSFYSFSSHPYTKVMNRYVVDVFGTTISFEGYERFQTTSFYTIDEYRETSTIEKAESAEDIDKVVGAIQISLLPLILFDNKRFVQNVIGPIVKTSINAINSGKLPYGVTNENKENVKEKLLSIETNGLSLSPNALSLAIDEKCK